MADSAEPDRQAMTAPAQEVAQRATTFNASYDAVVVGARIAGTALAYQLASRGWRVALVERARRPLPNTLSVPINYPRALARFAALGLLPAIQAVAPQLRQVRQFHLGLTDDLIIRGQTEPYAGFDYCYILRRDLFDDALLAFALRSFPDHITLYEGCAVYDLLWNDTPGRHGTGAHGRQVAGVRARRASADGEGAPAAGADAQTIGATETLYDLVTPLVVGADGRFSVVARLIGAEPYGQRESSTTLHYVFCQGLELDGLGDAVFVPSVNRRLVVASDVGEGTQVISTFYPVEQYAAFRHAPLAELQATWEQAPALADRIRNVAPTGKVMGLAPQPGYFRAGGGAGWALVGDAAHFKDPASGQGFHDALFTVQRLLAALDALTGGKPLTMAESRARWPQAATQMTRTRDRALLPMYRFTYQFGEGLTRPPTVLERALLHVVASDPGVTRRFMGISSGATPVGAFNRAAPWYLLRGLPYALTHRPAPGVPSAPTAAPVAAPVATPVAAREPATVNATVKRDASDQPPLPPTQR